MSNGDRRMIPTIPDFIILLLWCIGADHNSGAVGFNDTEVKKLFIVHKRAQHTEAARTVSRVRRRAR